MAVLFVVLVITCAVLVTVACQRQRRAQQQPQQGNQQELAVLPSPILSLSPVGGGAVESGLLVAAGGPPLSKSQDTEVAELGGGHGGDNGDGVGSPGSSSLLGRNVANVFTHEDENRHRHERRRRKRVASFLRRGPVMVGAAGRSKDMTIEQSVQTPHRRIMIWA